MKKGFILLLCLSLLGCSKLIVSTEGSIDKKLCEKVQEQYDSLPDKLKKECKSIVLCDLDSFEINDKEIVDGNYKKDTVMLLVDERTKSIKDYKAVLVHEIGHILDDTYHYSSSKKFKKLFEENGVEYYDLGIHNANEFFCEALSLYITSPKELKDWSLDVYTYMKNDICF